MEDGYEGHARFLNIHTKKGLAIFKAAETIAGMSDKESSCLSEALEVDLKRLRGGGVSP
jgi:hypothetical protein